MEKALRIANDYFEKQEELIKLLDDLNKDFGPWQPVPKVKQLKKELSVMWHELQQAGFFYYHKREDEWK